MTEPLEQEIRTLRSLFWSERDPDGRGFAPLADAYRRAGDSKQALELLDDGIGRHPGFVPGHVVAARLYMDLAFFAEAELAARQALDLDAENVEALRVLIGSLEGKGASGEAREFRNRLAALEPLPEGVEMVGGEEHGSALDFGEGAEAADEPAMELDALEPDEAGAQPTPEQDDEILVASAFGEADHGDRELKEYVEPTEGMGELDVDLGGLSLGEVGEASESPPETDDHPVFDSGLVEPEPADEPTMDLDALAPDEPETADEPTMDLDALAPDEPETADEPAMELDALAPDEPEPVDEPTMDLDALAPDEPEPADEPTMDLDALAPDEPETADEPAMDLDALAPDEPAMDLDALAPDEPEAADEPAMELDALAPDEPETVDEPAMELDALAPDEPTMDLDALAPDEPETVDEPAMDLDALAPDEPEAADEPAMDLDALAPDEPEAADEPAMDLDALAPDEPEAADEPTMDLDALAPDEPETIDEPTMDLDALAPDEPETVDEPAMDLDALAPDEPESALPPEYLSEEAADAPMEESEEAPIFTRTIAALYVKQGLLERALEVYRTLAESEPDAEDLAREIDALESQLASARAETTDEEAAPMNASTQDGAGLDRGEEQSETLARELAESGEHLHDVDTPFAWTEDDAEEAQSEGPPVADYFARMLAWEPEDGGDDGETA